MNSPWKAPFMCWFEGDFWSYNVRKMPPLARLMYRSLLQAAWHSDNPPYAPNNEADLIMMADAPTPAAWREQKPLILERFEQTEDGKWLFHPKSLAEYQRALALHEKQSEAGKRRWEQQPKSISAEPPAAHKGKRRKISDPVKTALPEHFSISPEIREWAEKYGHTDLEQRFNHFIGYVKANGKRYADWNQAFQNAVRDDWAKIGNRSGTPASASEIARRQQAGEEWRA